MLLKGVSTMEIIRTFLMLFLINNSPPLTTQAQIREAITTRWRVAEIVQKRNNKNSYTHQRMVYKFNKDGSAEAFLGKRKKNLKWSLQGNLITISMPNSSRKVKAKILFVTSTAAALKKIKDAKSPNVIAFMFIKAMNRKK